MSCIRRPLLLADVVLPTSNVAAEDLRDIFAEHELAVVTPPTYPVHLPSPDPVDRDGAWAGYVRALWGALTTAADLGMRLGPVYSLISEVADAPGQEFGRSLSDALLSRGVTLIRAAWDHRSRALVEPSGPGETDGLERFAAWTPPGRTTSPTWLLIAPPFESETLGDVHSDRASDEAARGRYPASTSSVRE